MNLKQFYLGNSLGFIIFLIVAIIAVLGYSFYSRLMDRKISEETLSFVDCESAGYLIMESYPRQCRTPDGRLFVEEILEKITYINATSSQIQVDLPFPGAVVGKEFRVNGKARGGWYFEASFPVEVLDKDGKSLAVGIAQVEGDWMTDNLVPFKVNIKVPETYIGPATLILKRDNPSGMKEYDASISFPITIEY